MACHNFVVSRSRYPLNRLGTKQGCPLIETVALGSTQATVLLSNDVALVDGLVAFTLRIGLQFVITWLSVRSQTMSCIQSDADAAVAWRGAA